MKLSTRWKKLNIWNKFFVITGILGVISSILAVIFYFFPYQTPPKIPPPPFVFLSTEDGYTITEFTGNPIDPERVLHLKQHSLNIRNDSNVEFTDIDVKVLLPEPVVYNFPVSHDPGTSVKWEPYQGLRMTASPGVEQIKGNHPFPVDPSFIYRLEASRLGAGKSMEIRFITSNDSRLSFMFFIHDSMASGATAGNKKELTFDLSAKVKSSKEGIGRESRPPLSYSQRANYLKGTYQFKWSDEMHASKIVAPIHYDERRFLSIPRIYTSESGLNLIEYSSSM